MKTSALFFLFFLMMCAIINTTSIYSQELSPNNSAQQIYPGNNSNNNTDVTGLPVVKEQSSTEIKTIVNEYKPARSYLIGFNASDLPGGAYFYKMTINGFTDVKKMILMK